MVSAAWVALILLGAVLYGVLVYLVSIGSRAEGMRDPATAPVWRVLLAGGTEEPKNPEASKEAGRYDHHRAA
jgi:hypothetical protein